MPNARIYEENFGGLAKVTYNVGEDGGAVGDILLPLIFPKNSVIIQAFAHVGLGANNVILPLTSTNSSLVTLSINDQGDLINQLSYNVLAGYYVFPPTLAAPIITTEKRQLLLTVGDFALDEGIVDIFIDYRHGYDEPGDPIPPAVP